MSKANINNAHDRRKNLSWLADHLAKPDAALVQDLLNLMNAWLHSDPWVPSGKTDIQLLWKYIELQGLGGIAGKLAMDGKIDSDLLDLRGTERYLSNAAQHAMAMKVCKKISSSLCILNMPAAVMKGPSLAELVYQDGGIRAYSDIDLFMDSENSVYELLRQLSGEIIKKPQSKHHRFADCVKIDTRIDRWLCEFTIPSKYPAEPVYELMNRYLERIVKTAGAEGPSEENRADPTIHMVYLIIHMVIGHFYSRYIWFVDLEMMYRKYSTDIDFAEVHFILSQLSLTEAASTAIEFCRNNLKSQMPEFIPPKRRSRKGLFTLCAQPSVITVRRYSLDQIDRKKVYYNYLMVCCKFFLLTDRSKSPFKSPAVRWTTRRFLNPMKIYDGILYILALTSIALFVRLLSKAILLFEKIRNIKQ
mgnify:CR=1 FL=1